MPHPIHCWRVSNERGLVVANKYNCSNGERVSQAVIDSRRSAAYKKLYYGEPHPNCGCGIPAQGTAHLIAQHICKKLGMADYCWKEVNMVEACFSCNSKMEVISTVTPEDWFYERLLKAAKIISEEIYLKLTHEDSQRF